MQLLLTKAGQKQVCLYNTVPCATSKTLDNCRGTNDIIISILSIISIISIISKITIISILGIISMTSIISVKVAALVTTR